MAAVYLTYDDYKIQGGALDAAAFERHEYRARRMIDEMTHGRVRDEAPTREAVVRLAREMIDLLAEDAAQGGREVAAASNDGVSVSYAVRDLPSRCAQLARDYLSCETTKGGVPLLYAGVGL